MITIEHPIFLLGLVAGFLYLLTVIVGGELRPGYTIYQAISELTLPASPNRKKIGASFILFNILLLIYGVIIGVTFSFNFWLLVSGLTYVVVALAGFGMIRYPMDPLHSKDTKQGTRHNNLATVAIVGSITIIMSSTFGFHQVLALRSFVPISLVTSCLVAFFALGAWISAWRHSLAFGSFQKASLGLFMIWLGWSAVALSTITHFRGPV